MYYEFLLSSKKLAHFQRIFGPIFQRVTVIDRILCCERMVFVRAFPFEWSLGRCVSGTSVDSKRPIDSFDVENSSRWFRECKTIKENYEKWRESKINIPFTRCSYALCVDRTEAFLVVIIIRRNMIWWKYHECGPWGVVLAYIFAMHGTRPVHTYHLPASSFVWTAMSKQYAAF